MSKASKIKKFSFLQEQRRWSQNFVEKKWCEHFFLFLIYDGFQTKIVDFYGFFSQNFLIFNSLVRILLNLVSDRREKTRFCLQDEFCLICRCGFILGKLLKNGLEISEF